MSGSLIEQETMSEPLSPAAARPVTPLGIVVQKLGEILQAAEQADCSDSLTVSLREVYALAAGLDPYIDRCTTPDSAELSVLLQKTAAENWSQHFSEGTTVLQLEQEMLSGHLEGQTLKMLVHMTQAKRILEIGMFTGYSALAMAEALPEDGSVTACEVDRHTADFARRCFASSPHGHKIRVEVAPALDILESLAKARMSFDFVFVDADKQEYIQYFKILMERELLSSRGFICVDNTLLQGQPYLPSEQRSPNGDAIAQFNRFVADDLRVEQVLLPIRDGLTIIRRK
jgi:caffeoyl-CoA O-methyltransferase